MRSGWWSMGVAALLALAPVGAASAQEAPPPRTERGAPVFDRAMDDDAMIEGDMDGLDLDLLAADDPSGSPGGPRGERGMARGGAALRELNLSDDQRRRLADIRDKREREIIPIRSNLQIAALDLRKLMRADHPETRAINTQIDRIATLRASMQKARVAGMLEARNVLTPEQQKMMREHRGTGAMRMREWRRGHGSMQ